MKISSASILYVIMSLNRGPTADINLYSGESFIYSYERGIL
jgi:hypothetical protein